MVISAWRNCADPMPVSMEPHRSDRGAHRELSTSSLRLAWKTKPAGTRPIIAHNFAILRSHSSGTSDFVFIPVRVDLTSFAS